MTLLDDAPAIRATHEVRWADVGPVDSAASRPSTPESLVVTPVPLADLLVRIAEQDAEAFREFYDRTGDRVYGMTLRVLRDPGYSEETTQEVYLQVWRTASGFDPTAGSALSWLITLAHRRAVDRVRSEVAATRRDLEYGVGTWPSAYEHVGEVVERHEMRTWMLAGLAGLTALQREAIVLAYYHGLSYREVAERLTVSLPTVKSRIRDGLRRLRDNLDLPDH
ncbi:ECF RNA polymerase sigma factor SigK [Gordonia soli]|uniref:RNA polymerase ECF-type sigma factor SigK n=1 Tax=Gordonia soli NBRC 108243 TaxID=1223545 RepID=M0QM13_9ACTN|nr:ECF RNA polymerase sigma factor SigK [Gordonia soli]GAC69449.1 RNA polymerase ECF-type sigma factor SigK [Gordonia soli NBRC 108243]